MTHGVQCARLHLDLRIRHHGVEYGEPVINITISDGLVDSGQKTEEVTLSSVDCFLAFDHDAVLDYYLNDISPVVLTAYNEKVCRP